MTGFVVKGNICAYLLVNKDMISYNTFIIHLQNAQRACDLLYFTAF